MYKHMESRQLIHNKSINVNELLKVTWSRCIVKKCLKMFQDNKPKWKDLGFQKKEFKAL
jgi:hypothetical protein